MKNTEGYDFEKKRLTTAQPPTAKKGSTQTLYFWQYAFVQSFDASIKAYVLRLTKAKKL